METSLWASADSAIVFGFHNGLGGISWQAESTIKLSRKAHPITASNRRVSVEETKLEFQFAFCNTQYYNAGIACAALVQELGANGYA
jgi:hypothetical protein